MSQLDLLTSPGESADGFVYQREFISADEEQALIGAIEQIPFFEIRMYGVIAKRRAAHFGHGYEYQTSKLGPAPAIPDFLLFLRERVAKFTGRAEGVVGRPAEFAEVLVTDYPPGAGIGWHRDAPPFDVIVGVSLLAECTMHFRPWPIEESAASRRKPLRQVLEPRSIYILRGPSRTAWQHHIPTAKSRRISITFRTLRNSLSSAKSG